MYKGFIVVSAALSISISLLAGSSVAADETRTSTTKTAKPDMAALFQMHYENRVKSFKDQNLVYQNVVLLGDSITEGFDVTQYLPGQRVINRGIGADVIGNDLPEGDKRGVLKRLDSSVFDCSPTVVFILIGINDLGMGHTPETIEAGYRDMLSKIRERLPQVVIHVQSVLPCSKNYAKHNANILDVNKRIKGLAAEFHCNYIDLHSQFANEKGELKDEFTNEGLHLTPAAYKVWADIVRDTMGWNTATE